MEKPHRIPRITHASAEMNRIMRVLLTGVVSTPRKISRKRMAHKVAPILITHDNTVLVIRGRSATFG
jgi:hypothetical protein